MADRSADLKALDATLTSIEKVLDVPKLREELADLEEQAAMPGLWDDQDKAQRITGRMSVPGIASGGTGWCFAAIFTVTAASVLRSAAWSITRTDHSGSPVSLSNSGSIGAFRARSSAVSPSSRKKPRAWHAGSRARWSIRAWSSRSRC